MDVFILSKSRIINVIGLLFILTYIITHRFCPLPNIFEGILSIGGFILIIASVIFEDIENKKKDDLEWS